MARRKSGINLQRYLMTGILTVIPIWITYVVFEFIFRQLSKVGEPWAKAVTSTVENSAPKLGEWLTAPALQSLMAAVLTVFALYMLGFLTTLVIGKRLLRLIEMVIDRIPYVKKVYSGVKQLLAALQTKPENLERVVLIAFPSPEMKTVGFVTRIIKDQNTGEELASVYVPTTPNPTSGYIEIVPVSQLVSTDWSFDDAMSFIISGGTVSPQQINYRGRENR